MTITQLRLLIREKKRELELLEAIYAQKVTAEYGSSSYHPQFNDDGSAPTRR
jgi:hypothetical protein